MSIKDKYHVERIRFEDCKEWCLKKHYAKRIPQISYAFGLFNNENILKGICTFGLPPSDGFYDTCGNEYKNIFELNRLIKDDNLEKNLQTWFVSQCFKLLPNPSIIISYSDPNYNHYGYTYQALNFLYTGEGGEGKEYIYNNKRYNSRHIKKYWFEGKNLFFDDNLTIDKNFENIGGKVIRQKPKHRYIIFLGSKKDKKNMFKNFKFKIYPYPKGENKRYDASYQPTVQGVLF